MNDLARSLLIGLATGAFGGLVGLGGGVVMVPLLVGVARLRQLEAHGTSLVALVFTGMAAAATYAQRGAVDLASSLLLAGPAMVTARLGARSAHALPEWKARRAFGGFLVAVTLLLLAKPWLPGASEPAGGWLKLAVLLPVGGFSGFLSGMMGVGGGAMMVPAMVLLAGFPQALAQGSSLLAMVPAGAAGAQTHWRLGNVAPRMLPGLVPGILLGTVLGSSLALWLDESWLRAVFSGVLLWTGARYLGARKPEGARKPRPA